jgi:hypothetical protein
MIFAGMTAAAWSQNFIDILPGSHSMPITGVTYEVDGSTVVQNSEASGVQVNRDAPVYLKSVTIQDGSTSRNLDTFNSLGAVVVNIGFTSATGGVGVFDNGAITTTSNLPAFASALAGTTQDTDLLNYNFYDGVSNMPGSGVSDYDLLFQHGFEPTDFVLVSERWGNTFFTLTPLNSAGDPISGANTLRFGYPTGSAYTKYDWNSGYASSSYNSSQAMAFSVAAVSKFFEASAASSQPVFGFRIDNNGEADVKFFGLSDDSFINNPLNSHSAIPEPSVVLLAALALVPLATRRRR